MSRSSTRLRAMIGKLPLVTAAALFACTVVTTQAAIAADAATQARLDSLERKLDSRGMMDMLSRIDQLQRDMQRLHGDLEVQTHTLDDMQRRQRELYLDMDRRLQQLESQSVPGVAPPPTAGAMPITPAPVTGTPIRSVPAGGTPVAPPSPRQPVVATPAVAGEKLEYDAALAILREGRYADAAQAFKKFLTSHPGSQYAGNASYWLGETYYVTRDFDAALAVFAQLAVDHPQSTKLPDSRLKTGFIHYELKDWDAARTALTGVVETYPGSTPARLAEERLQRMKKEGH
ncbi:MAG: tol-pal system protein YbgF [Gammaproteobacteria bacterium]